MTIPDGYVDGQSLQALDQNQQLFAQHGYGVVSGCGTTIFNGTLGSTEATVEVASGTVLVDGTTVSVSSNTLGVPASDTDPRKDLVVYNTGTSSLAVVEGTPEPAEPTGAARQQAENPNPPSLESDVDAISSGGDPRIPLAELWIPADAAAIVSDDIFDRRQGVKPIVADIDAAQRVGIPVYSADGDAPNETVYFNSSESKTKYKDSSGTVHDAAGDDRTDISDNGTAVVSDVTDINFSNNLGVTDDGDGSVTVNSSETATLYMSDYSSGGVADTAFESAIADASTGDTIIFDRHSYELQSGHQIAKSLIIDQTADAELVCTNTANANSSIEFLGGGQTGTSTTTSAAISSGAETLAVNDSSAFAAGDDILIMDNAYAEQAAGPHQFQEIESVPDGTTINLMGSAVIDFISGANVYQVNLIDSPVIRNISTRGGGTRHLAFRWCKDPLFERCSVSEYLEQSLYALDCWKPVWRDVQATDPEAIGSGQGEPLAIYRCSDAKVDGVRIYDCRRGIDFAWGTHSVDVIDPVIHRADIAGISVHGDDIVNYISIQGGTITNRPSATTGFGVTNSASCTMSVEGTSFISDRAALANTGPMKASNCHIKPVGSSAQNGIQAVGSDGHYQNMVIEDPNAHFNEPVRIDTRNGNVQNVTIEANIEYAGQSAVIINSSNTDGSTIDNVDLKGTIHGGTTDQPIFIWAESGAVDDIDVMMDVYGTAGQCIRLLADNTLGTVRVHDCTLESTDSACIFDSADLGNATIQINNCYLDSGSGTTTLSFNNGCKDLFVLGNFISGSVDTSGTITNQVVMNNLP